MHVRITITALLVLAASAFVASISTGGVAAADAGDDYRAYAVIRQHMIACSLDRTWHHMGASQRRRCKRLRKLYVLWSEPGESGGYHIHCRTRRCPPQPIGEPNPRVPIPRGAVIFR